MSAQNSDFRRMISATGVYAAASLAQKGLALFLIPVYTRYIDTAQYGVLELLSAFATVFFGLLALGLPSAIMKVYHRDCEGPSDRSSLLATAGVIGLPALLIGGATLFFFADPVGRVLTGTDQTGDLVRLVVAGGMMSSLTGLIMADLRAEERALAYSSLVLTQFVTAMVLNIVFVVVMGLGIEGVLWGNLLSHVGSIPLAVMLLSGHARFAVSRRLVIPLLSFGALMVPGVLTGWVMELSDRYLLRMFGALGEVGIYSIGYKFGMVLKLIVVWPFQLAWPAFSFAISNQEGHKKTFARTLTYLAAVLVEAFLAVSILSRVVVPVLVGESFQEAYRVVPLVALAYVFEGLFFCLNPGVHLAGKTKYLPPLVALAAGMNVGLNLLLIPQFGMMGAAAATAAAYLFAALGVWGLAQRFYPVSYEYKRLLKIVGAGAATYWLSSALSTDSTWTSFALHGVLALLTFPALLWVLGFLDADERLAIRRWARDRASSFLSR